jgi:energy-coupling factor transporter ATP-binding protein EcfA2
MRVAHVKIRNILGISELEFEAGSFNAITGQNGEGKTSVLNAIRAGIGREGDEATLLKKGETDGEIVIVMDDGSSITKKFSETGPPKTTVRGADGGVTSSPGAALKGLTDLVSVNPVDFLRSGKTPADKRQRLAWLLECLPTTVDRARLEEIAGAAANVADTSWAAFDQIEAIFRTIFEDRTNTNRAIREREGSINQLELTLPDDEGEGGSQVIGDPATIEAELAEMDKAHAADLEGVSANLTRYTQESGERVQKITEKAAGDTAAHRAEIDRLQGLIRDIERGRDADIATERDWMRDTAQKAELARARKKEAHTAARQPHVTTLEAIRAGANAVAKAAQTRAHIRTFRDQIDQLEADEKRQTTALDRLQAYKSELLENIPIRGLTVDDGEIYRDGVPFDRLNTAQTVDIAVEIAKLRARSLAVICVDGIENLDTETFEAFREKSIESGLQLFVTRVTDEPFAITTTND